MFFLIYFIVAFCVILLGFVFFVAYCCRDSEIEKEIHKQNNKGLNLNK